MIHALFADWSAVVGAIVDEAREHSVGGDLYLPVRRSEGSVRL